jgi:hypothetical protein
VLVWAAAYAALVGVAVVLVRSRREPTIVRGDWIFLFTALYVLVAAGVTALRGGHFSLGVLGGAVVVLLAGWFVQPRWWVIGSGADAVAATIEECASRLCAPAARSAGECTVTVPGGAVRLRVAPAGRSTMIVFVGTAKHRKAQLFRRLLAKQYRSVIPPIRLGTLGASRSG